MRFSPQKLLKSTLEELKKEIGKTDFTVYGAICDGKKLFTDAFYSEQTILAMGSEQKGLSEQFLDICDELLTIPMAGQVDSLNLAVATSLILFDIFTKRR